MYIFTINKDGKVFEIPCKHIYTKNALEKLYKGYIVDIRREENEESHKGIPSQSQRLSRRV